ncbi:MAG: hypothetical protein HPY57_11830 [Ignavibacteria bacterium]|nr:hypothetical protein [Ignavibacteria bacterium]
MKKVFIVILIFLSISALYSQQSKKEIEEMERLRALEKSEGIIDRAGGVHNASNIGLFFENRGKLYPRRLSQGPSGEFPINSGKHYIYRINPFIGVPDNVVQGRFTTNEEWEAVGGYHNPQLAKIAMSDKPDTWHPVNGWPIKDQYGNPIFKSDQDSYCVFSDSNNSKSILGLEVHQIGYTYGVKFAQNIIFYKYLVINKGKKDLDSLYFAMYCDIDVGNVSGGVPEYADDKIGFLKEKNFLYFYDAKGYSREWPDGKTGYFGVAFLRTPEVNGVQLGITDMHYNLYDDDRDIDSIQYWIMSSDPRLYNNPTLGPKYFHLGPNPNIHYDDPNTIPASGLDIVATISSGPYKLNVGDTLVFITAIIAGDDYDDAIRYLDNAYKIIEFDFEISKPPATPTLTGWAGDRRVILIWDDKAEKSKDSFSGEYDFEGYRVYKSLDKGVNWQKLADYDLPNKIGLDRGLRYSYIDTLVVNGIEYWYCVTSYDRGDTLVGASLESPLGKDTSAINTIAVIPYSKQIGRISVSSDTVAYIGTGNSNYQLIVDPTDKDELAGGTYELKFSYVQRTERGKLLTKVTPIITDSSRTEPKRYGIEFISKTQFHLIDLYTGDYIAPDPKSYLSGATYTVNPGMRIKIEDPDPTVPAEFKPKAGDYITLNFAATVVKNGSDTLINQRPFWLNTPYSTPDGILFSLVPPDVIRNLSRVSGSDFMKIIPSVSDTTALKNMMYLISVESNGFVNGAGFISVLVRNERLDTIMKKDTIRNLESITFNGINVRFEFQSNNPPSRGNVFSFETVVPVLPNLRDAYRFSILPSRIESKVIKENLSKIKVVPNPYVVSSLFEPEFGELRREPLRQLQFINLPNECTIYIFTLDGDLIKTIYHNSNTGTAIWDLRAEGGREISTGIYLYVVKTSVGEYLNRFAVIK